MRKKKFKIELISLGPKTRDHSDNDPVKYVFNQTTEFSTSSNLQKFFSLHNIHSQKA